MASIGLVGGGFVSQSAFVDDQKLVNFFPEIVSSNRGRVQAVLYRTPGLLRRITGFNGVGRGALALNGHAFVVMGAYVYDVIAGWTINATYGPISNADNSPVSMAANPEQLFIISDGLGYIITAGVLTQIADPDFPADAKVAGYVDGYFLAMTTNFNDVNHSNAMYFSAVGDGTSWDALDFIEVLASANSLMNMVVDNEQVFLYGTEVTVPFQNVGGLIPFLPIKGGTINLGTVGNTAAVVASNSTYFVGANKEGGPMIYRLVGYAAQRVSNHDIETAIQGYGDVSDCVASSFQINGHTFVQFTFPSVMDPVSGLVGATWRMDVATPGMWHEALSWNGTLGQFEEHLCRHFVYVFDKHLALSRSSGIVYEMNQSFLNDDGATIRRLRRCPHIFEPSEDSRMFYPSLRLVLPTGTSTDLTLDPKVMLQWSSNWGQTWSNVLTRSVGVTGDYTREVLFNRLGSAVSSRVFEFTVTDDYDWVFTDAQCPFHRGK